MKLIGTTFDTCHELVGTRWQRRSQSYWLRRRRLYGGARPRNVSSPRGSELLGPRHCDQGDGTPEQEGKVSGAHSRDEERSWASTRKEAKGQERRKGWKEQRSALRSRSSRCAVVFQLEFRRWDVWRAFTGKPMSGWQSSQVHHVSVGQALGKAVSTGLTRSRGGRNWDSGGGPPIFDCARRRLFDFPALFFGPGKIRVGRGNFGSRSSARYQGQSHQPRHPPRWHQFVSTSLSLRISLPL